MLTVAKVTQASAAGYSAYLEGKTTPSTLGDYYLKEGERIEAPGRWVGGAEGFDIDASVPVSGEQLRTLMAVQRPDTGAELRRSGGSGQAVAAIDATFSAPKSVSAVWALADPILRLRIERAHEQAIDRAVSYAVRQVPMLRRRVGRDDVVHEKSAGVVATSWRHTTARSVADQVPDPQLHSHVLLHAGMRRDGELVAIDSRSWLVHQREVGAAYRTELARELNHIGFSILRGTGRGERYFELGGVPQALLDRWSSRHRQVRAAIEQRLAEQALTLEAKIGAGGADAVDAVRQLEQLRTLGQLAPSADRQIAAITRTAKVPATASELDTAWRLAAHNAGISPERVQVLARQRAGKLEPAPEEAVLEALTEFDAAFPARDARAVALERSAGTPIEEALDQLKALREREEILVLADRTGTTREHRGREHTVVQLTERLAAATIDPVAHGLVAEQTEQLDQELAQHGGRLSAEQRQAIELACGPRRLVVIEGQAGTGKSTTLTGITRAHQQAGQAIIVTSTAGLAAERLASELVNAGVRCTAYSTAALHTAVKTGRVDLRPETTIVHDEAALASTREQLQLLTAVDASGARLIEVGDPHQNQPVGAAGLWPHLERTAQDHDAHVELTINQRAHDPADRRDQARFRDGEAELSLRGYAAREHLHLHPDQRTAEDHALDAAHHDRAASRRTVVIAQTSNEHLDELNARAQAIRQQHGELGEHTFSLPGRPYDLHPGDEIQIRHTITHPDHGPLRNGTTAKINQVDQEHDRLTLRLGGDRQVTLNRHQSEAADLRLSYVQHPFPAQGITTDTAHLITDEHATREGTYVALTRAREHTRIHAAGPLDADDRIIELAERLNRSEPDVPSIHTPLVRERAIAPDAEPEMEPVFEQPPRIDISPQDAPGREQPAANEMERVAELIQRDPPAIEPHDQHRGRVENDLSWEM